MSEAFEHEFRKKMNKVRENMNKKMNEVRDYFAKVEKVKVDALKKNEEMRRSIEEEILKIEGEITQSADLSPETKEKLSTEITNLKDENEKRAAELRTKISQVTIP